MIEKYNSMKRTVLMALEEDLGTCGDLTTEAIVDPKAEGEAVLIAREELILAGLPVFKMVFREISTQIEFEDYFKEGDFVPHDKKICLLKGHLSPILKAERTALNLLQRMSGIATLTRQYVKRVEPYKARIIDTRKTAPGLRWMDKYAVRVGGGFNHRFGLFDGILIKDNHIAAAGSIKNAIESAKRNAPHTLKIEVEVEDFAGVKDAVQAGADIIMLDNMNPGQMKEAVSFIDGRAIIEASGGISLETVSGVAECGVDLISIGALTHSAKASDLSLEICSQ
ncbi:MAG TPA: carboxylating nicotinate-nucleotide diphosphorylase [Desulfobacteraceae bacterium]|nr:carboxylating nicotinate-nucleotide diphosphorylase [Desulfobacteraceae bacterium]HPJ67570.1 carboxylating nicotinate-nucleotide diphosphorylase [Desulfobacteraceae bacterium]HPQ29408.1 carboxylating nicotinate-nucleotide diphosphorylase [Desulfobacteraceae bacterium]